jgi:hypothetical protein
MAGDAARDAVAARAISEAAKVGNSHAREFVDEAKGRIAQARVRAMRADEIRKKAALASVSGAHKLAILGADVAAAELAMADSMESSVVDAVRSSYGAAPFYVSPKEARLWRQSEVLSNSSTASIEKAFSSLLDKTLSDASNYGLEDPESEEVGEDDMAADRIGLAAEVFGGHLPVVLGAAAFGSIKDTFKASREKLEKRLAQREDRLAKLQESVASGKKVAKLKTRVNRLKKSIAKTRAKLKKLNAAESKVNAAQSDASTVAKVEDDATAELMDLENEEEELEPFEISDDDSDLAGEVLGADDDLGEDELGEDLGRIPGRRFRPGRGRGRGPGRGGGRGRGPWRRRPAASGPPVAVVVPYVEESVEMDEVGPDYEDSDDDSDFEGDDVMLAELAGEDGDIFGGGGQPVSNLSDDAFVAFFDRRSSDLLGAYGTVTYGAGSQPLASVVELYGTDESMGGILDNVLDFFSDLFTGAKKATKKATSNVKWMHKRPAGATAAAAPKSVLVKDGPYAYRKDSDGRITIVSGPSGAGKSYLPGTSMHTTLDAAVQREVGAGRSQQIAPGVAAAASSVASSVSSKAKADAGRTQAARDISMNPALSAEQKKSMLAALATSKVGDDEEDDKEAERKTLNEGILKDLTSFGDDDELGLDDSGLPEDDGDLIEVMTSDLDESDDAGEQVEE